MLTSTVVTMRAQRGGLLPRAMGEYGHAAFLSIIREIAPDTAQLLHDLNGRKPFTVSPLQGPVERSGRQIRVQDSQRYWMRFTLLDSDLYTYLTRCIAESTDSVLSIELRGIPFAVEEVTTTEKGHAWGGYTTFSDLWEGARPVDEIPLRFHSLTAFSLGDTEDRTTRFALFPTPELVFESLCQQWNRFSDDRVFDSGTLRQFVADRAMVKRYRVSSDLWHYRQHPQAGFSGYCVYGLAGNHPAEVRQLNVLADFAFYSGVGYHTTMGMGQCRRMSEKKR